MRKISPFLLLVLLLASCMQVNTMYNARKYFNAAQARPLNANGRPSNQAVEEYTKTIQKCGIILSNPQQDSRTDDALFLLARALYYKGNSAFQAKDQFESLIRGFPESPFFGEAHIYLARVLREINRNEEADKVLQEFILDSRHKKLHPRALLTLAEFKIAEKDYLGAQFWLSKIITEYPRSEEYREAFFSFGQNYYIQNDYRSALGEFEKIANDRRISQQMKLDARYYIALNQFMLGEYEQCGKTLKKLLKDELRPEKLSQARVLQARLYLANGEAEKGLAEIEDVSKVYPRTLSSAEAQYHLGEYYFYEVRDLDRAGTAYNKVRTEFMNSELTPPAQKKATAITQLKNRVEFQPENDLQQFVDYQVAAAENYFNVFNLPDSSLVMYQRIIDSREVVAALRDSVVAELGFKQSEADSLMAVLAAMPEPVLADSLTILPDSLAAAGSGLGALADSLRGQVLPDSTRTEADSLRTGDIELPGDEPAQADSIQALDADFKTEAEPDSLYAVDLEPEAEPDGSAPQVMETELGSGEEPLVDPPGEDPVLPVVPQYPDETDTAEAGGDSLIVTQLPDDIATAADSLDMTRVDFPADGPAHPDSIDTQNPEEESPDPPDLLTEPESGEEGRPGPQDAARQNIEQQLAAAQTELEGVQQRLQALSALLNRYDRELVPLALFSQASIHNRRGTERERMETIFAGMTTQYSENKYTNALGDMLAGQPVRLIDPAEEAQEQLLERALGLAEAAPDSMRVILEGLTASDYLPISLKANFRLGWHYTFEAQDTTAATSYLNKVLELDRNGDYGSLTARFFDGRSFKLASAEVLADSLAMTDSLAVMADSTSNADSLGMEDRSAEAEPELPAELEEEASPPAVPENPEPPLETEPEETEPEETDQTLPDETPSGETPTDEILPDPDGGEDLPPPDPDDPAE